jgi:hypothetical protein
MPDDLDPEPPPKPRRGAKDWLDPSSSLSEHGRLVFRALSISAAVVIALAACAFAVCFANFKE